MGPFVGGGDDLLRFDSPITGAALRVEETEQLLQRCGIGRIPEECALTADLDQVLILSFSRWCKSAEFRISSSAPMSPTTMPSGYAESSKRRMRTRGSVPIADSMSRKRGTSSNGSLATRREQLTGGVPVGADERTSRASCYCAKARCV